MKVSDRRSDRSWDAIVIGSGATGGVAGKALAERGLAVLILEAGRAIDAANDYRRSLKDAATKLVRHVFTRRQTVQSRHATYWATNPDFFVDDVENPYSVPRDKPFYWVRGRVQGGRTLIWDGVTPRLSDYEFRAASRDGVGIDWPIGHADLAPYYARLERYFGVHGHRDGLRALPDGAFVGEKALTPVEGIFKRRVHEELPERHIIVSRGLDAGRTPTKRREHSPLSNLSTTLRDALRTGKSELRTESVASRILLNREGTRAVGVEYVDAASGAFEAAYAPMVFVCASTIESVRLLLNSATNRHPNGLGGASGHLGRYLMDHIATNVYFQLPDLAPSKHRHPLRGSDAFMVPRYANLDRDDSDHLRGFGMWGGIERVFLPRLLRRLPGEALGFLCARGEVLPHRDNRVVLDPTLTDAWNIPSVRIECEWKDNDRRLARAARRAAIEMIEAAGGEVADIGEWLHPIAGAAVSRVEREWRLSTPGLFAHELGGARMGRTREESVVDGGCAVWDVPNVYVTDGACWPSSGWQNPTLTEMAITARAVDLALGAHGRP